MKRKSPEKVEESELLQKHYVQDRFSLFSPLPKASFLKPGWDRDHTGRQQVRLLLEKWIQKEMKSSEADFSSAFIRAALDWYILSLRDRARKDDCKVCHYALQEIRSDPWSPVLCNENILAHLLQNKSLLHSMNATEQEEFLDTLWFMQSICSERRPELLSREEVSDVSLRNQLFPELKSCGVFQEIFDKRPCPKLLVRSRFSRKENKLISSLSKKQDEFYLWIQTPRNIRIWLPYLLKTLQQEEKVASILYGGNIQIDGVGLTPRVNEEMSHIFNFGHLRETKKTSQFVVQVDLYYRNPPGHANILFVDNKTCTMELFEPRGPKVNTRTEMQIMQLCETFLRTQSSLTCSEKYQHLPFALICPRFARRKWLHFPVCEYYAYIYMLLRLTCHLTPRTGLFTFFSRLNEKASAFLINQLHCYLLQLSDTIQLHRLNELMDEYVDFEHDPMREELRLPERQKKLMHDYFSSGNPAKALAILEEWHHENTPLGFR
jgi:hypothetical protein